MKFVFHCLVFVWIFLFCNLTQASDLLLYVPNTSQSTVSVVNTDTGNVDASISVGAAPVCVVLNSTHTRAYVSNQSSNTVSVINTLTNTVVATVSVGSTPPQLAIIPDDSFVYVVNGSSDNVSVIDTSDNTVIDTVNVGGAPQGIAANPNGGFVYVSNYSDDTVSVINTATNSVVATVSVCHTPRNMTVNPDGTFAHVLCDGSSKVSLLDLSDNTVAATYDVTRPYGSAFSNDGSVAYFANYLNGLVYVYDTSDYSLDATVTVGTFPLSIAVDPVDDLVYVSNYSSNSISVIDPSDNSVTRTFTPVGGNPYFISFGRALAPLVSLSSSSLSFATTDVGASSATQNVVLTNTGNTTLNISSVGITGDFSLSHNCGATVAVSGTCTLTIGFEPESDGNLTGTLSIASDAASSPDQVSLSGTGQAVVEEQEENNDDQMNDDQQQNDDQQENDDDQQDDSGDDEQTEEEQEEEDTEAVLGVTITTTSQTSRVGDRISFQISLSNSGNGNAESTVLTIELSENVRFISATLDDGGSSNLMLPEIRSQFLTNLTCSGDRTVTCEIGTISNQNALSVNVQTQVVTSGNVTISASLAYQNGVGSSATSTTTSSVVQQISYNQTLGRNGALGCHLNSHLDSRREVFFLFISSFIFWGLLRFKKTRALFVIGFISWLWSGSAQATQNHFSLNADVPSFGSQGLIYSLGAKAPNQKYVFSVNSDYSYKPVELTNLGRPVQSVVDQVLTHFLGMSFALNNFWHIEVVLPVVSYNRMSAPTAIPPQFNNRWGLGDLHIRFFAHLLQTHDEGISLAVIPFVSLPTGNETYFVSNKYPRVGLKFSLDGKLNKKLHSLVNVGFETGDAVSFFDYSHRGRLLASTGLGYQVSDLIKLNSDLVFSTALNKPFQEKVTSSLEALVGVRFALPNTPLSFSLNQGLSLVRSSFTPLFRSQFGVEYSFGQSKKVLHRFYHAQVSESEKEVLSAVVLFRRNSTWMSAKAKQSLVQAARLLKTKPAVKIALRQCTQSHRQIHETKVISLKQVLAVQKELMRLGVRQKQIVIEPSRTNHIQEKRFASADCPVTMKLIYP